MGNRRKVLIIDDEEVVLDSCTEVLAGGDYDLATAGDGDAGLKLVETFQPDLVFVDLKMPGVSGFEVLERLQAYDPTIVTIVITGYATVSSAIDAMKRGAYDFLPKPFTPEEFRLIARRGIEKRSLVQETMALRREREALRENFAAIVSHELKSPLGAIQQNLFVLERELAGTATADHLRRLERMKSRIDDLLAMINTWLRGVSVDITAIREDFKPVSIDLPISKAIECNEPHATRKDISIVSELEEPAGIVFGDEVTLTEALVNIIGNAVKYSHAGSEVAVKAERRDGKIVISVSDSGVGIPKEDLTRIFDDFYRAASGVASAGGAGVGLAISRRIIEAHDGSISADSELGLGSTFVITLPAIERDSDDQLNLDVEVVGKSPKGGAG